MICFSAHLLASAAVVDVVLVLSLVSGALRHQETRRTGIRVRAAAVADVEPDFEKFLMSITKALKRLALYERQKFLEFLTQGRGPSCGAQEDPGVHLHPQLQLPRCFVGKYSGIYWVKGSVPVLF